MTRARQWLSALLLLSAVLAPLGAQASPATPSLHPDTVTQGGMLRATFPIPEGREVERASLVFGGQTVPCYPRGDTLVGLLAVGSRTTPGRYAVNLWVRYVGGAGDRFELPFTVTKGSFPTQSIKMPRTKTGLMSDDILEREKRILYGAMERTAPEPLWEGVFANPLPGRISSPFGRMRYVNGRFWGAHSGRDVASPAGKAVRAPNHGRVLVSQQLWMRGNTIMLDHGMGVFSLYNHLSRLDVKPGQMVRKGDVIGLVGSTGFSTGPHLHWEMRIHRIPTDPAGPMRDGINVDPGE